MLFHSYSDNGSFSVLDDMFVVLLLSDAVCPTCEPMYCFLIKLAGEMLKDVAVDLTQSAATTLADKAMVLEKQGKFFFLSTVIGFRKQLQKSILKFVDLENDQP